MIHASLDLSVISALAACYPKTANVNDNEKDKLAFDLCVFLELADQNNADIFRALDIESIDVFKIAYRSVLYYVDLTIKECLKKDETFPGSDLYIKLRLVESNTISLLEKDTSEPFDKPKFLESCLEVVTPPALFTVEIDQSKLSVADVVNHKPLINHFVRAYSPVYKVTGKDRKFIKNLSSSGANQIIWSIHSNTRNDRFFVTSGYSPFADKGYVLTRNPICVNTFYPFPSKMHTSQTEMNLDLIEVMQQFDVSTLNLRELNAYQIAIETNKKEHALVEVIKLYAKDMSGISSKLFSFLVFWSNHIHHSFMNEESFSDLWAKTFIATNNTRAVH